MKVTKQRKEVSLETRLKTIKDYHILGESNALSKSFVEKAINDAMEIVKLHQVVKL